MRILPQQGFTSEDFPEEFDSASRGIAEFYVREILSDSEMLLEEFEGEAFSIAIPEGGDYERILASSDPDNIVNAAVNMVVDPSETIISIFSEPDASKEIRIYILETRRCTFEFLRFVKYILDDVEDEDDGYVPPYEVSQY